MSLSPLAARRVKSGLSSAHDAAARLGISRVHLANIECGLVALTPHILDGMADLYACSPKVLEAASFATRKSLLRRKLKKLA